MILNSNTQLGLRYNNEFNMKILNEMIYISDFNKVSNYSNLYYKIDDSIYLKRKVQSVINIVKSDDTHAKFYYLNPQALTITKKIKIPINFNFGLLTNVSDGTFIYLINNSSMLKFTKIDNIIQGFSRTENSEFQQFWIDITNNEIWFSNKESLFINNLQMMIYVHFGDITIKTLPSGHIHQDFVMSTIDATNQSKHDINIVDSIWNTIIIRDEEFGVNGHFRFQPIRNKQHKLIYIKPFKKHGYVRNAKSLTHKHYDNQ